MDDEQIWRDKGWTAEIVKNEDDDGWALAMTRDGDDEPVLVVPWVMGRNKKDPKPLNKTDFATQLKAAEDFLARSKHQARTAFRRSVSVYGDDGGAVEVVFDVVPGEYEPQGVLVAQDAMGTELARVECPASTLLTLELARTWVDQGFGRLHEEQDW